MKSTLKASDHARALAYGVAIFAAAPACAQSTNTTLIDVTIPDNFDRGRNQSVLERPRPDYDAQPVRVGSFNVLPSVELGVGASDNVYQTNNNKQGDGYGFVKPALVAASDWSLHSLEFAATGNLKRYIDETPRNLSLFAIRGGGRLDLPSGFTVFGEARYNREFESAQTGAVQVFTTGAFSTYDRLFLALRAERQVGQSRITLAFDHTGLDFRPIKTSGLTISQSTRDRVINRATARLEYAFTPSVAIYSQVSYENTDYSIPIAALKGNRDSDGARILVGASFDLAGFMRGKIGVGYGLRNYKLPIFDNVSGFSADVKLEYFPTELTTVTFAASRTIEDTAIGSTSSYNDTRASLRVDHELLRNLLLHGLAEVAWQDYFEAVLKARNYRLNIGAEYFSSRKVRLRFDLNGYHRKDNGTGASSNFYEKSAEFSVIYFF